MGVRCAGRESLGRGVLRGREVCWDLAFVGGRDIWRRQGGKGEDERGRLHVIHAALPMELVHD